MSTMADSILVRLRDPMQLAQVLLPAGADNSRVRQFVEAVFAFPFATLRGITTAKVGSIEMQRPIFALCKTRGTWTQTVPSHRLTDITYEESGPVQPIWLDIAAELQLTLLLEADAGAVASVMTKEVSDFTSLDDFRTRFAFMNVDALLAKHNITTVDELRDHYHFLQTEIRLRTPPPFDPSDASNQYAVKLNVAVLVRDVLDVRTVLQEAKLLRKVLSQAVVFERDIGPAQVQAPYAILVIWPDRALQGQPLAENDIVALFAMEKIVVAFLTLN